MKLVGMGWWKVLDGATMPVSSRSMAWCWEKADCSCSCWCITGPPIMGWDQPDIASTERCDEERKQGFKYVNLHNRLAQAGEGIKFLLSSLTGATAHSERPDATLSNWRRVAGGQHGVVDWASLPDPSQTLCPDGWGHFAVLLTGTARLGLDQRRCHGGCAQRGRCSRRHRGHRRLT